ncbi:carboxylesterase-mitochondrial 37S ribosomal protein YmS2 [Saccharomycopsis crataegensis]|uniref:Protein phosphatase methylesterase 1 n=1 Tax=Saccharomycopsis crataegensis TaxID=43959 RepID=A0AAV5QE14_9ASCO|nr:carboxylesterase-mitochondrial 37S ribosomal protein YmS2 [Saccharomycopsis crataegensis]
MSQFQKSIFQKKLQKAEQALGFDFSEELEDQEEEQDNSSSPFAKDAPLPTAKNGPLLSQLLKNSQQGAEANTTGLTSSFKYQKREDIKPKEWCEFFEHSKVLEQQETGNKFQIYYSLPNSNSSPIFIFHHGAGSSGLTFAVLGKQIEQYLATESPHPKIKPGILVFDARNHGKTKVAENDYSRNSFVKDFSFILKSYLDELDPLFKDVISKKEADPQLIVPPIMLVGHSLGGSVLTEALHQYNGMKDGYFSKLVELNIIKGLVMFDIVEDTAVESLAHMNKFLNSRPKGFRSLKIAIDWHIKSNFLRKGESPLVSVPALLMPVEDNDPDVDSSLFKYKWRSDLRLTEPFWDTWFTGLSGGFVNAPVQSKLLILAGNDNLDKRLMIGQMQGKFQLIVFLESGHFLHEDLPNKTAISLIDFWKRNFKPNEKKIPILWGHMRN